MPLVKAFERPSRKKGFSLKPCYGIAYEKEAFKRPWVLEILG